MKTFGDKGQPKVVYLVYAALKGVDGRDTGEDVSKSRTKRV